MRKHKASRKTSIARRRTGQGGRRSRRQTSFRGPLPRPIVRADDPTLTSHAGLLPVITFMSQQLDLVTRLREIVGWVGRKRVHPTHLVLLAFVVGALAGVERMAHLDEALRGDPVLVKFLRLASWPVRKVFAGALASSTAGSSVSMKLSRPSSHTRPSDRPGSSWDRSGCWATASVPGTGHGIAR